MANLAHLAKRFIGSLRPGGPSKDDVAWAVRHLNPGEAGIWSAMSGPDRRHSVQVARDTDRAMADLGDVAGSGEDPFSLIGGFESVDDRRRIMVAAALMHDSGKIQSGLGTFSRVAATLIRPLVGDSKSKRWAERTGMVGRFGRYWLHPELGAQALERAGSHPLVATWAGEHHRPAEKWTVPVVLGQILKDCDDD